jgi:hypothetical protein
MTRGRVCRSLLAFASTVTPLSESHGTHDHILPSQIRDSLNWRDMSPYLYPPGKEWPNYNSRHWILFLSPPTTRRATVEVFDPSDTSSRVLVTTDGQSASLSCNKAPIWGLRPDFYYCQTNEGLLMLGAISDERTGLSFTIADDPRQLSQCRVRVPRDTRPYFTVSDSRLPFRRLLKLAGLRWRYSTPPPHEISNTHYFFKL